MDNKVVDKIRKLFALATSPNEHEARLAAERANELLIKHNLRMQDIEQVEKEPFLKKSFDVAGRHCLESKYIFRLLRDHFFVQEIFFRNKRTRESTVIFVGEETNLEVAQYVYNFLKQKYYELWLQYKLWHVAPTSAKQSYYEGLTRGLNEQFQSARKHVETEMGLVVIRDPRLDEAVKDLKTFNTKFNLEDENALEKGREDGKQIRINKSIESETVNTGKLLK